MILELNLTPSMLLLLTAVCWLVRPVTAIVLRVTFPPERNALVILTHKLKQGERNELD